MGNGPIVNSKEIEERVVSEVFNLAKQSGMMPDIGIDSSLKKYSGLNSATALEDYSSELLSKAPGHLTNLGAALTAFKRIPNAVGLGALVVSFMLDLMITVSSLTTDRIDATLNMMRRVFGEEKASGVRDSMDEYMKRLSMHMKEPLKVLEETERLEKQLSEQLTRLRNSMLHDNQMSSRSMKQWTNGAAFHVQMLIHAARLKTAANDRSCETDLQVHVASVSSVVLFYQRDLQELMIKYKTYKLSTISLKYIQPANPYCFSAWWRVRDDELGLETGMDYSRNCKEVLSDVYVDYMFQNWSQIEELKGYFADLNGNIRELILQHDAFNTNNIRLALLPEEQIRIPEVK